MLVKYLDGTEAHVHPDMGRALVAGKLATQVQIPKKKITVPDMEWLAIRGEVYGNIEEPPRIFAKCKGCGQKTYFHGPKAHLKFEFRHNPNCGPAVKIPSHIQQEYARLRKIHDAAIVENKRKAAIAAKFEAATRSALAAART